MEIIWLECVESTQIYLIEAIKQKSITKPTLISTHNQTKGIGSRGNAWLAAKEGLYFSLCHPCSQLPHDLPLVSSSIYFAFLFKEILASAASEVWLKWPNDLYIRDKKIGGVISNKVEEFLVIGIGLNYKKAHEQFGELDVEIKPQVLLEKFVQNIKKQMSWKQIFSKYKLEFNNHFCCGFHYKDQYIRLEDTSLCEDGALLFGQQKIYSLR